MGLNVVLTKRLKNRGRDRESVPATGSLICRYTRQLNVQEGSGSRILSKLLIRHTTRKEGDERSMFGESSTAETRD